MKSECSKCRFAELTIEGNFLNNGGYECTLQGNPSEEECPLFQQDELNADFEYSYVS